MKKLILTTVLFTFVFLCSVSAQEAKTNPYIFKPYWYVGANGGYNLFMGEGNNFLNGLMGNNKPYVFNLKDNGSFLFRGVAGYNFTPVIGLRGMLGYVNTSWPNAYITDMHIFSSENLTADVVWNLSNLHNKYNPNRKFDFSLFAGLGIGYRNMVVYDNLSPISGLLRAGLQGDYKLTHDWALNVILEGNVTTDNYNDDVIAPLPFDLFAALTVGVTYRLPEQVKKVKPVSVVVPTPAPVVEPAPIAKVEPTPTPAPVVEPVQVAKAEPKPTPAPVVEPAPVAKVEPTPTPAPVVEPAPIAKVEPTPTPAPVVQPVEPKQTEVAVVENPLTPDYLNENIYFNINQRDVKNDTQVESLQHISDYVKVHPAAKIIISGYADRGIGTDDVNNFISKQRAVNVANTLIQKYGVPYKNVWVRWFGSSVQPYMKASMNRLVIVRDPKNQKPTSKGTEMNSKTANTASENTESKSGTESKTTAEKKQQLFKTVNFINGTFEITEQAQKDVIKKTALYLQKNPEAIISVSGYADNTTDGEKKSAELSKNRALAVANTLIKQYSISANRIQVRWYGARKENGKPSLNKLVLINTVQ